MEAQEEKNPSNKVSFQNVQAAKLCRKSSSYIILHYITLHYIILHYIAGEGVSTVKRIWRSDIRHSEPLGMKKPDVTAPLKKSLPYNISPAATPSMSANDSGNESV